MNTFQTAFSSARFNRLMIAVGGAVLVAGALALLLTLAGGSDRTSRAAEPGFKPQLPANSQPLKNANGKTVRTFFQLDPTVRSTIRTFIATAVARKNLDVSWKVTAPSVKQGYTFKQWKNAKALPIIPYPGVVVDQAQYYLDYASTKEILVEVGLSADSSRKVRPTTFQLGLTPVGKGASQQWLVDYWMPRWTPPLPTDE